MLTKKLMRERGLYALFGIGLFGYAACAQAKDSPVISIPMIARAEFESESKPSSATSPPVSVEIKQNIAFDCSVSPNSLHLNKKETGRLLLAVTNTGNIPQRFQVTITPDKKDALMSCGIYVLSLPSNTKNCLSGNVYTTELLTPKQAAVLGVNIQFKEDKKYKINFNAQSFANADVKQEKEVAVFF